MEPSSDFVDLLSEFNAEGVEYLIVGAHALAAHGHVRATKDLDVWVRPSLENGQRVMKALVAFRAPVAQVSAEDFAEPDIVYQIGVAPVRVDIVTGIDGVEFDDAWQDRVTTRFGGVPVQVLSIDMLIRNKRASGRLQDLADVEALLRFREEE